MPSMKYIQETLDKMRPGSFPYDGENKKEYLLTSDVTGLSKSTFNLYCNVLSQFSRYEEELNKPLLKMSVDEINDFLKSYIVANVPSTISTYVAVLRSYATFMQSKNLNSSGMSPVYVYLITTPIRPENFINMDRIKNLVFVPSDFDRYINSGLAYDKQIMCSCLLMWDGINRDDVLKLTSNKIKIKKDGVYINNNKMELSSNYKELFSAALEDNECAVEDPDTHKIDIDQYIDSKYFIKKRRTYNDKDTPISFPSYRKRINDMAKLLEEPYLAPQNIVISRKIYDTILKIGQDNINRQTVSKELCPNVRNGVSPVVYEKFEIMLDKLQNT